jgi:alpha-beta hydrolase superfamily lysophospholipase
MGGCVGLAYALRHQEKLDGLALSAPLAVIEAAPLPLRLVARTLSVVSPNTRILELDGTAISRDPEEVRAYDEDPLNFRGKLPARTLQELVSVVSEFEAAVPELTLPLLVMYGTADRLVPPAAGKMVGERAGSTDKTVQVYDGFYHELFNEPAGERERPLGALRDWLTERVA